jgi:hypothetical protein
MQGKSKRRNTPEIRRESPKKASLITSKQYQQDDRKRPLPQRQKQRKTRDVTKYSIENVNSIINGIIFAYCTSFNPIEVRDKRRATHSTGDLHAPEKPATTHSNDLPRRLLDTREFTSKSLHTELVL